LNDLCGSKAYRLTCNSSASFSNQSTIPSKRIEVERTPVRQQKGRDSSNSSSESGLPLSEKDAAMNSSFGLNAFVTFEVEAQTSDFRLAHGHPEPFQSTRQIR